MLLTLGICVCGQSSGQQSLLVRIALYFLIEVPPDLHPVDGSDRGLRIGCAICIPCYGKLVSSKTCRGHVSIGVGRRVKTQSVLVVAANLAIFELKVALIVEPWLNIQVVVSSPDTSGIINTDELRCSFLGIVAHYLMDLPNGRGAEHVRISRGIG